MKTFLGFLVVVIIVAAGALAWVYRGSTWLAPYLGTQATSSQQKLVNSVTFACNDGKTISAQFYQGPQAPAVPNQPPKPSGSVALSLSDGRSMTLPQTISGSGVRYANADESIVFWDKGNGAFITENNQQTYTGCISEAKDPGGLPQAYENGTQGFSIRYPQGYTVDDAYRYTNLGPGKAIGGVKFTIDPSIATGTNLGSDSYLSVEEIPQASACDASLFVRAGTATSSITEGDMTYSFASSTDAAAGNRYEEDVFAMPGTNPCVAVRYFIHYSVFENYPTGSVKQFDEASLKSQFDAIRKTLILGPQA